MITDPKIILFFFLILMMIAARQATKKIKTEKFEIYDDIRIPIRK